MQYLLLTTATMVTRTYILPVLLVSLSVVFSSVKTHRSKCKSLSKGCKQVGKNCCVSDVKRCEQIVFIMSPYRSTQIWLNAPRDLQLGRSRDSSSGRWLAEDIRRIKSDVPGQEMYCVGRRSNVFKRTDLVGSPADASPRRARHWLLPATYAVASSESADISLTVPVSEHPNLNSCYFGALASPWSAC